MPRCKWMNESSCKVRDKSDGSAAPVPRCKWMEESRCTEDPRCQARHDNGKLHDPQDASALNDQAALKGTNQWHIDAHRWSAQENGEEGTLRERM
eukprot:1159394-Pelagomonas_calceolata.AAC.12